MMKKRESKRTSIMAIASNLIRFIRQSLNVCEARMYKSNQLPTRETGHDRAKQNILLFHTIP